MNVFFRRSFSVGQWLRVAACAAAAVGCVSGAAVAQSYQDVHQRHAIAAPALAPGAISPFAKPGPVIYVCDDEGQLATITLGTYAVHRIGYGVSLTDIAFNPKDGHLYGIDFSNLYLVNRNTAQATYIGSLGISDANALVFSASGEAFTAGVNTGELYSINIKTGLAKALGSTAPFVRPGTSRFITAT